MTLLFLFSHRPFRELNSQDSIGARLITQSAVLYEFTMKSLKQCMETSRIDFITAMANIGVKLMQVHNKTIKTLNKYRHGGEQKVTVTHKENIASQRFFKTMLNTSKQSLHF
jgi:hypothetical protein